MFARQIDDGARKKYRHTIKQSTARQIRIHHPMLPAIRPPRILHVLPEAQIRNDPMHSAQFAILNHFPNLDAQREKPSPHRFHQKQLLLPGRLDQFLRLRRIDRERLLAQYMFARLKTQHGILVVVGVRGGDVDDVDVWVFDELFVRAVSGGGRGTFASFEELFGAG